MSEQTKPLQVHEVLPEHIGARLTVVSLYGESATGTVIGINHEAGLVDPSTVGAPMFNVAVGITTTITLLGPASEGLHRFTVSATISYEQRSTRHA